MYRTFDIHVEDVEDVEDVKYLNKGSKAIQILCVLKHVGDVRDVIYINKRSKATLNRAMLLMSETSEM